MSGQKYRLHPITILSTLWRYLIILVFPLLRGFLHALKGGFSSWLQGAWMDILLIMGYLAIGVLAWYMYTIEVEAEGLSIRRGLFVLKRDYIPKSRFTCITVVNPFYLKLFGGVFLRIDTPGGSFKKADVNILMKRRDCESLVSECLPEETGEGLSKTYRPKGLYVLILSAITSNSFAGVVFISTFITQTGEILGKQFAEILYGSFEEAAKTLAFGIPPAAAAIAYILFFGYLSALVLNLFRHANFSVLRVQNKVKIHVGLFTNRTYTIDRSKITYIDMQRTLTTAIFGLSSVFLHTVGFGKYKDDISALIPCANKKQLKNTVAMLLPEYIPSEATVKPWWKSFFCYASIGLSCCGVTLCICILGGWFLPNWKQLIYWVTLFCLCPSLWYLSVQIYDLFTAGISYKKGCFTLRYAKGFYLHRVIIMKEKISGIRITQSIFQKMNNRCNIRIFSYSEGRNSHFIRDLPMDEVIRLFRSTANA